ncbi:MAG: sigma-70 family RNA polymerase sigma factor [Deltaproteobacteria bacterium]|nr:sigma-70 family RNA polymerase sigma factor [Deltaproteobacteria bacterium]
MPEMHDFMDVRNEIMEDDDAAIVARCRQGDTEAFAFLVRRHQKKMLNVVYRMIGNYDEACDIVQEGFLSTYRAIGKFRGDAQFSTWLCGIMMNHARTHLQQRALHLRRTALSLDDPVKSKDGGLSAETSSQEASVVEKIEKHQLAAKVQECIGQLDGEQREVIVLRDIQGFSYDDIGATLKIPPGTVRSRLFRARQELKERLLQAVGDLI